MTDPLIRITTAVAVVIVAAVAAVISYRHVYELVRAMENPAPWPDSYRSPWTASSGPHPWPYSMPAAAPKPYRPWPSGASA